MSEATKALKQSLLGYAKFSNDSVQEKTAKLIEALDTDLSDGYTPSEDVEEAVKNLGEAMNEADETPEDDGEGSEEE